MKVRRSPQEKKRLSLARDRRNTYGERGAQSRFAIAESKALAERANRRTSTAALKQAVGADEATGAAAEERVRAVGRHGQRFIKSADEPLGEVIARKHARRRQVGMTAKPPGDREP